MLTAFGVKIPYLVAPETLEVVRIFNDVRSGEESALNDTTEISQVKQVVRLGRRGQQVRHGILVHF